MKSNRKVAVGVAVLAVGVASAALAHERARGGESCEGPRAEAGEHRHGGGHGQEQHAGAHHAQMMAMMQSMHGQGGMGAGGGRGHGGGYGSGRGMGPGMWNQGAAPDSGESAKQ